MSHRVLKLTVAGLFMLSIAAISAGAAMQYGLPVGLIVGGGLVLVDMWMQSLKPQGAPVEHHRVNPRAARRSG